MLGENVLKEILEIASLWNKNKSISSKKLEIISIDDLDIVPAEEERQDEEIDHSQQGSNETRVKSSSGNCFQQRVETCTGKSLETVDVVKKVTNQAKKAPDGISMIAAADFLPILSFDYAYRLNGKLTPVHTSLQ